MGIGFLLMALLNELCSVACAQAAWAVHPISSSPPSGLLTYFMYFGLHQIKTAEGARSAQRASLPTTNDPKG